MSDDRFAAFDEELRTTLDRRVDELADYCRIPSLATEPASLDDAAEWTRQCLADAGATVAVLDRPGAPALITGELGSGPHTIICLHHYDVQPVEPLDAWTSPPFQPTRRGGRLYGRGTLDNKGSFLLRLHAVSAYMAAIGELPVRVRFLVEGEEESGSPNLAALIAQRPEIVEGSAVLNEGGYHDSTGRPQLTCGIRGMLYVELRVRAIAHDVHSELAMLLPNAGWRLVHALASLTTPDQGAHVAALGDTVRAPTAAQVEHVRRDRFDEDGLKELFGIDTFVRGLTGDAAAEAAMFAPTLNLSGVTAGWTGPGIKTVIPAVASAKLDFRLVPDQTPEAVLAALREHLDAYGYSDVEIHPMGEFTPWWTPVDVPLIEAAAAAVGLVYGCEPARLMSSMSSAPLHQVCSPHGLPSVGFGCAHPDSAAHAPDEHIRIDEMLRSARVFGRFLETFGSDSAPVGAATEGPGDAR